MEEKTVSKDEKPTGLNYPGIIKPSGFTPFLPHLDCTVLSHEQVLPNFSVWSLLFRTVLGICLFYHEQHHVFPTRYYTSEGDWVKALESIIRGQTFHNDLSPIAVSLSLSASVCAYVLVCVCEGPFGGHFEFCGDRGVV